MKGEKNMRGKKMVCGRIRTHAGDFEVKGHSSMIHMAYYDCSGLVQPQDY